MQRKVVNVKRKNKSVSSWKRNKVFVTTASGNHYTVIDRVKFTDKEYRQTRLKL